MRVSVASDRGCYQDGVQLKLYYVRYIVPGVATIPGISSLAPGPSLSQINDSHVAEKWSEWKELWEHYSVDKEERDVQVTRDWTSIGPKARKVFKTWHLSATERKVSSSVSTTTTIRERIFTESSVVFLIHGNKSLANHVIAM